MDKQLYVLNSTTPESFSFNSTNQEILTFTPDGEVFHMGRKIESDEELKGLIKKWIRSQMN